MHAWPLCANADELAVFDESVFIMLFDKTWQLCADIVSLIGIGWPGKHHTRLINIAQCMSEFMSRDIKLVAVTL